MPIISLVFLLFTLIAFAVYFIIPYKWQPYWLLVASLIFYLYSDIRYIFFLGFSIITTFILSHFLNRKGNKSKVILIFIILINIGLLFTVKYLPFSFSVFQTLTGLSLPTFSILVPLGISFYTLQAVGYCIDIYKGKYAPEKNFAKYMLFMSYFPIILQGPISRYNQLAEQLFTPHSFDYKRVKFGLQLALWGLFKKMVIADRAAILVNQVFDQYTEYQGLEIFVAALMYTVQIYTDFSGCVDISRGISQVFGIELIKNFDHPYFAISIQDFWKRWHISLSSWLRDYVYIPLGGNRKGICRKYINVLIVFIISGLWHGVGFHYLAWGILHGAYQIIGALTKKLREAFCQKLHVHTNNFSYQLGQQIITFFLVTFAWIFFRAQGFRAALRMIKSMLFTYNPWVLTDGSILQMGLDGKDWNILLFSILVLLVISLLQTKYPLREKLAQQNLWFRWGIYFMAIFSVLIFGIYGPGYSNSQFIYMQF